MLPVTVRIGGFEGRVLYAGAAPGLIAGVLQVNAPGRRLLEVGQVASPPVTIAVR